MKTKEAVDKSGRDAMSLYMSDVNTHPLFTKEQETAAFRLLEQTEADILRCLLSKKAFRTYAIAEFERLLVADQSSSDESREAIDGVNKGEWLNFARFVRSTDCGRDWTSSMILVSSSGKFKLSPEKSEEVRKLSSVLSDVKNLCIQSNLKLVFSHARRFASSVEGMTIEDLIQEGNLGLIKAVDKFDVERGFRFSTYALWWIKATVRRGIADKSLMVRIPVHLYDSIKYYYRFEESFVTKNGRKPTREESISLGKMTSDLYDKVVQLRARNACYSIDTKIGDGEGDSSFADMTPDENIRGPEENIHHEFICKEIHEALKNLTRKEKEILKLRFGFDQEPLTLQEIGDRMSLSRERIRQIESASLRKLRFQEKLSPSLLLSTRKPDRVTCMGSGQSSPTGDQQMSDNNSGDAPKGQDFVAIGPKLENGSHVAVRHREDHSIEVCTLTKMEDGKPLLPGHEMLEIGEGEGPIRSVKTLYSNRKGPAKVSTSSYRSNWDEVFGKKDNKNMNLPEGRCKFPA